MHVPWFLLVVLLSGLVASVLLLRRHHQLRGIGLFGAVCPRCAQSLPPLRKAASFKEALWGGWTCPNCGCKVDRYGKERDW